MGKENARDGMKICVESDFTCILDHQLLRIRRSTHLEQNEETFIQEFGAFCHLWSNVVSIVYIESSQLID
jgi:hypothetical protein